MQLILPHAQTPASAQLEQLRAARLTPFAPETLAFLAAFSARILSDHTLRDAPEIIALAYWFRPAALAQLQQRYLQLAQHGLLRPRGVVFHVAPANVDAVFVYAWFLALLCGNRNIVRISRRDSAQRLRILAVLEALLGDSEHASIARSNAVLSYGHDDAMTRTLSALCDLRVVWGGDASVTHLRSIALPPLATELVFPNRFAWTMLAADTVAGASPEDLAQAAAAFYNDAFWFDQQACSSPRAILWVGMPETIAQAQQRFWPAVTAVLAHKGAAGDAAQLAARLVACHRIAAQTPVRGASPLQAWPMRLAVDDISTDLRSQHCGYGLFYELQRADLPACATLFTAQDQTIAYWGFSTPALTDWAGSLADRAVDRIVKLGNALRFADRWDGHDLLQAFSRQVIIE